MNNIPFKFYIVYIIHVVKYAYIIHTVLSTSVPKVDTTNQENHISEQKKIKQKKSKNSKSLKQKFHNPTFILPKSSHLDSCSPTFNSTQLNSTQLGTSSLHNLEKNNTKKFGNFRSFYSGNRYHCDC